MRKNSLVMIGVDLHRADQLLPRHCAVAVRKLRSALFERRVDSAETNCGSNCILFTAVADIAL